MIVGGGPVGLLLAVLLAGCGIDVAVLERRAEASTRTRAIGIHPPALAVLGEAGIADEVLRRSVPIRQGVARSGGRTLGRLRFDPAIRALPQWQTERMLRARLAELNPDALRMGVEASTAEQRGGRVTVQTSAGRIEARFVVAADGARSRIRDSADIAWVPLGGRLNYLMADLPDTSPYGSTAVLSFERGGVVESFPMPDRKRRWVALTPTPVENPSCELLARLVRERTGDTLLPGGTASGFEARQHLASRMVSGRVALVGDAGHEISPIGGQGMNLGWLDAADLARTLTQALRHPQSALFTDVMLAGYDRRRRRSAWIAARQAGFNMSMGRPAGAVALVARTALMRTLAAPPTRELLAKAFTMRWL
ncbi:NAD(P)/FAD-dependent oxidoreductase [Salinibacterium sp. ZJ450]|uniref:FAD-dependent oxidoreductase n=1 Tax=Salinibacterium sp. ZJ450 TaxID=2708338 RepID=UPI0021062FF6|nr:NAD(P)/FAD-dependent oxidoreductase [Salinibacterium sp. ZJ450]